MNLTSPSQVKAWCIENGFHPNKVMGQNFLIDRNALEVIVETGLAEAGSAPHVLEIGPGLGVLTEEMLRRGAAVLAIEKDPVLAARLAAALDHPSRLRVIAGDALAWSAADSAGRALLEGDDPVSPPPDLMVSNLPYQAGTRILLELVRRREFRRLTVLVQTEVAERLAAGEGSKTRGLAGVWAQLDYDVKVVRKVAASCFWPRPEIGSSVVTLVRHDRNIAFSEEERKFFYDFTKTAFAHRRKQLGSVFKDMIKSTARAEELSNEDWIQLVKGLTTDENA